MLAFLFHKCQIHITVRKFSYRHAAATFTNILSRAMSSREWSSFREYINIAALRRILRRVSRRLIDMPWIIYFDIIECR